MLEALPVVRLNLGALRDREFADRPTGSRRARICCHARLTGCGSFENRTLVVSTLVQRLRARVEQGNLNSLAAGDRFTELGAQLAAPPSTGHQSAWRPRKSKARPSLRSVLGAPKRRPAGLRTPRRVRLLRHRTAGRLRSGGAAKRAQTQPDLVGLAPPCGPSVRLPPGPGYHLRRRRHPRLVGVVGRHAGTARKRQNLPAVGADPERPPGPGHRHLHEGRHFRSHRRGPR